MWWGGFSEAVQGVFGLVPKVLIPMWWGGFSETRMMIFIAKRICLNPHVVGRFFRAEEAREAYVGNYVLIPMWWGGFSEL